MRYSWSIVKCGASYRSRTERPTAIRETSVRAILRYVFVTMWNIPAILSNIQLSRCPIWTQSGCNQGCGHNPLGNNVFFQKSSIYKRACLSRQNGSEFPEETRGDIKGESPAVKLEERVVIQSHDSNCPAVWFAFLRLHGSEARDRSLVF